MEFFFERGCARVQQETLSPTSYFSYQCESAQKVPKISLPHCANTNLYYSAAISHYAKSFREFYHRAQFFPRKSYLAHSAYLFPHHTSYFTRHSSNFTLHGSRPTFQTSHVTYQISRFTIRTSRFILKVLPVHLRTLECLYPQLPPFFPFHREVL